ncbi:unnamed protein product [Ambrosiozyma monospora]|uniref:Unnamed protein product n=1 Tax=Ambrosiozyma monospora TaxID=43982 RepID=A0ACB5UCL3_AMBMO|nr:unnamed protein product [Ambrosiozyma monospora]
MKLLVEERSGFMRDNIGIWIAAKNEIGEVLDENVKLTQNLRLKVTAFKNQSKKIRNKIRIKDWWFKLWLFFCFLFVIAMTVILVVLTVR